MKSLLALTLLGLTLAMPACKAGRTNTFGEANPQARPDFVQDTRFINDPAFADMIGLVSIIDGEAPGGMRRVQAELFNDSGRFRELQYSFRWYSMDGMQIDSNLSQWKTIGIQPKDYARITGVAPSPAAVDFTLSIRRASR